MKNNRWHYDVLAARPSTAERLFGQIESNLGKSFRKTTRWNRPATEDLDSVNLF